MQLATLCIMFAGAILGGFIWYPLGRYHGGKAKELALKEAENKAIKKHLKDQQFEKATTGLETAR